MNEMAFFDTLLMGWFALASVTFVALFFVAAPYGRHTRQGWGPTVGSRLGWILMEAPAALAFGACFVLGPANRSWAALVLAVLWEVHYVHRALIYPLGLRNRKRPMPLAVVGMGLTFNLANGYLNGRYLFALSGGYPDAWLGDPRFVLGLGLFLAGLLANRRADRTLRLLCENGQSGYQIPQGGLYRWVSCPNYLGEIVEWIGWAVATWSLPGLAFAVWTLANLAPRARSHHRWYHEQFAEYPAERRALLPGVW